MFTFAQPRRLRRPSLTPMIDVVFLLLVFFMLAARFGQDSGIALDLAGTGGSYDGPPRLVELAGDGLRLNGVAVDEATLLAQLQRLTDTLDDIILLRGGEGADVQRVVDVLTVISNAGFTGVAMVE